ncbi:hypothetical protein CC77DRAFT_1051340 [Alternaria alternata]|uniref:Uncharacterized protein n=1 Tax=Alternaria alternata TaxID=5599 RepID=A0A177DI66_ALTAL|nr:hypothetical protein CC77DRAFT_1051340 [Alternaria alternata]OAG18880.1 hypothetical protein CC77DRAFT_1051340 [Alternaria alternata]
MKKYFRWTDDETVVVLNHIDWCLVNKQDYWQTIHSKFNEETGRVPDESQIVTRLKAICKEQTPRINYKHLIDHGTVVLEDATIAGPILEAMKYGRENLSLDVLEKRRKEIPPSQAGLSQRSKRQTKKKRRLTNHRHSLHDRPSGSRENSGLIIHHSQVDRKRKRADSVPHNDIASSLDLSNPETVTLGMTTESDLPAQLGSSESGNTVSHLHKRLEALEGEVKSMSELGQNTEQALKMAIQCITWVFREQVGPKNKIPEEIFSTMQLVERTIKRDPSDALDRLIKDLQQANVVRQRYQETVRDLIGSRDYAKKVGFPPLPLPSELAEDWRRIRSPLKETMVGTGAHVSRMKLAMTGSFSNTHLDDLAKCREGGAYEAQPWISTRQLYLDNPTAAQHLLAVVLCQLLFCGTETMCEVTPASRAFQIYRTVTEDREEIRRIDTIAFQLFTNQPSFVTEVLPDRIQKMRECLEACAREFTTGVSCNSPFRHLDFMSVEAVKHALSLKRALMLSVFEYEIHFATPGMDFDPVWMDAEDDNGVSLDPLTCAKMKVSICVFPGLVQAPTKKLPGDADVSAALLQAKSFFPPPQKACPSLEHDIIIAKAIVLVHDENIDAT